MRDSIALVQDRYPLCCYREMTLEPTNTGLFVQRDIQSHGTEDEDILQAFFSCAPEIGLITAASDGTITDFSVGAETIFGCRGDDAIGKKVSEIAHLYDEHTGMVITCPVQSIWEYDRPVLTWDRVLLTGSDSVERMISIRTKRIETARLGKGAVIAIRDIGCEVEVERMKADFISSISHELRTPLSSIRGFSSALIKDTEMPPETASEFVRIIDHEAARLESLVCDLLYVSRIESGTLRIAHQPADLNQIVKDVVEDFEDLAALKRISIEIERPSNPLFVHGDEEKLRSAIAHLLMNAVQHTPEDERIAIQLRTKDGSHVFRIEDSGPGIPSGLLSHIFERFYRIPRKKHHQSGTGVGLYLVKGIVDAHDGKVWAENLEPIGAAFSIELSAFEI